MNSGYGRYPPPVNNLKVISPALEYIIENDPCYATHVTLYGVFSFLYALGVAFGSVVRLT